MAPTTEFTDLKPELQSIERLINELLQRQSMLCSQLAMLESPDTQRSPAREAIAAAAPDNVPSSTSTPSWACVVKGRKKQSLPFYDPFSPGVNDVTQTFSPRWRNFTLSQSLPFQRAVQPELRSALCPPVPPHFRAQHPLYWHLWAANDPVFHPCRASLSPPLAADDPALSTCCPGTPPHKLLSAAIKSWQL